MMSKFIISCTTCSLRGVSSDEILSTFEHAPKAGYWAWGLAHPPMFSYTGGLRWFNVEQIKREAHAAGLIVCTEVYGTNLPSSPVKITAVRDMTGMFDIARRLGSPLVVITGGRRNEEDPKSLDNSVEFLQELAKRIPEYPEVRLALEPHYNSRLMTLEDFRYVFKHINNSQIGITVDTGHFYTAGVDISAFIHEFGKKVFNVHLKDHVGQQSVPIGEGEIDLKGIVKALDEIGYEGALAIEIEPVDPEKLPGYARDAYIYMRRLVKEVTGQET
jgi:sugar phosphate isomerase/epimerase